MEYRRRSLWNRVWENERLDDLGREEYVRRIYEEESRPWTEVGHGILLSLWKGIRWLVGRDRSTKIEPQDPGQEKGGHDGIDKEESV